VHIKTRNVNTAFRDIVYGIKNNTIRTVRQSSRNGDVFRIPEPLTITYEQPCERVLFSIVRDCNPFFHVVEALWMLVGRNDVETVAKYTPNMRNYSDDGAILHGAYGCRWREWFGYDQLDKIVEELKKNPDSRRCVLSMWNPTNTQFLIPDFGNWSAQDSSDLHIATQDGKDVPCNLSATFHVVEDKLDMTVFNRSNDLIWGTLGANVVHFSILQEYLSARIGVGIGCYHQVSSNAHVYENNWKPIEWLQDDSAEDFYHPRNWEWFFPNPIPVIPLVENPDRFEKELPSFVDSITTESWKESRPWEEPFIARVALPMISAFDAHKSRDYAEALSDCTQIADWAWMKVATNWIEKRKRNWERLEKQEKEWGLKNERNLLSGRG